MEIQSKQVAATVAPQVAPQPAPPAPVADQRPTADAIAITRDPSPETPLPMPPGNSQQALVGQLMVKEPEDAAKTQDDAPLTEAQRLLKPYGISMLPHRSPEEQVELAKGQTR